MQEPGYNLPKPVKKSAAVSLTLMASMALVACGPSRRCVDAAGNPAPDMMCQGAHVSPGYHWIVVTGGTRWYHSFTSSHSSSPSSSGVSRGGFGSTGGSHASGGSSSSGSSSS